MRLTLTLTALLALSAGVCRADEAARITVTRTSGLPLGWWHYVYVNGERLGEVGDGETKTFKFTPPKDGKNTLYIRAIDIVGDARNSQTHDFVAGKNAKVAFSYLPRPFRDSGTLSVQDAGTLPPKEGRLVSIDLTAGLTEKEISDEIVETPPGITQDFEMSKTIERTVTFAKAAAVEYGGKINLGVISGEVKRKIESQESVTFKASETVRRNVTLNGDKAPKVKVIWVGTFHTGTATIMVDGAEKRIPFTMPVGLKPKVTVVKD